MMAGRRVNQQKYLEQERRQLQGILRTLCMHGHFCESVELERAMLISQYSNQLMQVDRALRKLQQGTYGICDICQGHIDPARLHALPRATTCAACQQQLEQHLARS